VLVSAAAGAVLMLQFEPVTVFGVTFTAGAFGGTNVGGIAPGPVGLALGAALGAWLEWALLRRRLARAFGAVDAGVGPLARMFGAAGLAAAAGYGVRLALADWQPLPAAFVVAAVFGAVYFAAGAALGLPQARALPAAALARLRRGRSRG
jgi:putative peptidoglycan lipid II flippase